MDAFPLAKDCPSPCLFLCMLPSQDGFHNTSLTSVLQALNVDHIVVAGLVTSACVQHTAHGAFCRGFHVSVLHDACADWSIEQHEAALQCYGGFMYDVVGTEEWVQQAAETKRFKDRVVEAKL